MARDSYFSQEQSDLSVISKFLRIIGEYNFIPFEPSVESCAFWIIIEKSSSGPDDLPTDIIKELKNDMVKPVNMLLK